jgi:hypothetical protein
VELGAYLREVEALFVARVGRGFAMSASDVGRALKWHADGVPLRIVLGILDEAVRRRAAEGTGRRLTLGQLERSVAAAMKRRAERMVTGAAAPAATAAVSDGWTKLKGALEAAGRASEGALRSELRGVWTRVKKAEAEGRDAWVVAAEVDELLSGKLEGLLEAEGRVAMAAQVAAKVGDRAKMSAAAWAEREVFERACYLRQRFGVPELVAVMLGG